MLPLWHSLFLIYSNIISLCLSTFLSVSFSLSTYLSVSFSLSLHISLSLSLSLYISLCQHIECLAQVLTLKYSLPIHNCIIQGPQIYLVSQQYIFFFPLLRKNIIFFFSCYYFSTVLCHVSLCVLRFSTHYLFPFIFIFVSSSFETAIFSYGKG